MADNRSIEIQLSALLDDYSRETRQKVEGVLTSVARESVKRLKSTSPRSAKNGGEYASGWRSRKEKDSGRLVSVTVYNGKKPQITHLLENGHVIRNVKGGKVYGRTRAIKHIAPVEEWANAEVMARLEREL